MSSRRVDGTVIVTAPGDIEPGHRFRVIDEETIGFIPREGRPPTAAERAGLPPRRRLLADRAGVSERLQVLASDVQWLDDHGFVIAQWDTNKTARFTLDEAAFRYYESFLAKHSEEPAAAIEEEVRSYLDRAEFRQRFALAYERLTAAQQMLWQANPQDDLTTIGHKLREAIQQFATSMVEIHRPPGADSDPAKTKSRLRAVIETNRDRLGERRSELLDALLNYQSVVNDLVQRQEHGDQKPNDPLTWEDARAAVFQTAMLMSEFDRVLSG